MSFRFNRNPIPSFVSAKPNPPHHRHQTKGPNQKKKSTLMSETKNIETKKRDDSIEDKINDWQQECIKKDHFLLSRTISYWMNPSRRLLSTASYVGVKPWF